MATENNGSRPTPDAAEPEQEAFLGDENDVDVLEDDEAAESDAAEDEAAEGGDAEIIGNAEAAQRFEALLRYLKQSRGFDFTGYKRASLTRRVDRRMQMVGVTGYDAYMDHLEVHPDEFAHLFNVILINVTAFFRDAPMWDFIASEIVPQILASKPRGEPIRVWSAGCASGEETYTLAITLAEALGETAFRERVKIYGTDMDEGALAQARLATYTARDVASVPAPLLAKYFDRNASGEFVFHKDLRRAVIFGRHDLLRDAPIGRIDLLACRNTLMYFNAEMQTQALRRFHFALNDSGFLFMGKAEVLFTQGALFTPVDLKRRIFTRTSKGDAASDRRNRGGNRAPDDNGEQGRPEQIRAREIIFDGGPVAQIVIDADGVLTLANARARALFRMGGRDLGQKFSDLEVSYRPVELRSCLQQAHAERRMIEVKEILWLAGGVLDPVYLDFQITPLHDNVGRTLGAVISVHDVTRYRRLQQELEESNRELETAYEELQSANEELETTNEELQSTNEELETTNEELQSTNEELETMNEELQSTNEELQTVNEEMQNHDRDLNDVNAFLSSILTSLRGAVVVVNRDLQIRVWNPKAENLWGVPSDEARGVRLLSLDIGLPTGELKEPIVACLSGAVPFQEITVNATNRRGKAIRCHVSCTPLLEKAGEIIGAILLMEEAA